MLYFNIKNYEEFKERFGVRTSFSGGKSRNNGILLSFLKTEFSNGRDVSRIDSMDSMYGEILHRLQIHAGFAGENVRLNGSLFHLPDKHTDYRDGICEDGDIRSVRYVRNEDGRVYKMKVGKFIRRIVLDCPLTYDMAEQAIIWFCETFSEKWKAHAQSQMPDYTLVVDDDFDAIYDRKRQKGDFNSCMNNKSFHTFYNNCVKAKAASLRNTDGLIVARCVIFTEVKVFGTDKVYRLAERQYSSEQDNSLKQLLVDKLIAAGEIDGYKRVGAGCHDPHAFVLNDGSNFGYDLYIEANIGDCKVPYMDSFKYYIESINKLYNINDGDADYILESTLGDMDMPDEDEDDREWDEWHDEYCYSTCTVYCWNGTRWRDISCNEDRLDDFTEVGGEYYESDHVYWSDYHAYYLLEGECVHSSVMDDYLLKDRSVWKEDAQSYFPSNDDYEYEKWLSKQEELVAV